MGEPTRKELKAELEELKRQMELLKGQLQARQSGSGAIAQASRSVAAGEDGIAVGGSVYGDIYKYKYDGDQPKSEKDAIAIYLRMLVSGIRHVPMRGMDIGASDPKSGQKRLDLDKVYVALDTTTLAGPAVDPAIGRKLFRGELSGEEWKSVMERDQRPMTALEAAGAIPHVVILGDPGSGKSSFINHLALCIAMHHIEPHVGWLDRLPSCPRDLSGLIPIMVILRDFARSLPKKHKEAAPSLLWDFICSRLKSQNLLFASRYIEKALNKGKALVLLDGLDEIPVQSQPLFIKDTVSAFAERYPRSRMIVTCRTLSYQDANWHFTPFPAFQLAPFNEEKIDRFITAWYEELEQKGVVKPEEAHALASRLKGAVRSPDLWRMAPNPLLLTVMALVHTHKGCLPDARALLYEESIDILLWRWEQIKIGGCDEKSGIRQLLHDAGRSDVDLKRVLWRLAFDAHKEGGTDKESLAGIGEHHLEKGLADLHPGKSRDWAMSVIELMKLRAGLLLEREPEIYTFPHRTFQEHLAGAHLASQGDFARQATDWSRKAPSGVR